MGNVLVQQKEDPFFVYAVNYNVLLVMKGFAPKKMSESSLFIPLLPPPDYAAF